jgi:preprotein translocase subunit SecY
MKIPDLRRKILYTVALLAVYRIGSFVPVPGVDAVGLARQLGVDGGNIFGFLNLFTGELWNDLPYLHRVLAPTLQLQLS